MYIHTYIVYCIYSIYSDLLFCSSLAFSFQNNNNNNNKNIWLIINLQIENVISNMYISQRNKWIYQATISLLTMTNDVMCIIVGFILCFFMIQWVKPFVQTRNFSDFWWSHYFVLFCFNPSGTVCAIIIPYISDWAILRRFCYIKCQLTNWLLGCCTHTHMCRYIYFLNLLMQRPSY